MGLVQQIADAITKVESGGNPNSIAMRNNNPGNLRSWGNYPVVNGYVQFPDMATGRAALEAQVQKNISRGLTLYEFFGGKPGVYGGYAPAADANRPQTYAQTVAGWLGISPDVPLTEASSDLGFPGPDIPASGDESGVPVAVVAALGVASLAVSWLVFA